MLVAATAQQLVALEPETNHLIKSFNGCEARALDCSRFGCLVVQQGKPLILQFGKKESAVKKLVLPEKLESLRVSPCGNYLACGAKSGRLLVWSLESGQLLAARDAHFQALTTMAWTEDSAMLVTGGDDARVLVWNLSDLISGEAEARVLTTHTLEITHVVLGKGRWREARLYTASKDSTVCVWHLATLQRLSTLSLQESPRQLCLDPAERAIYAATEVGVRIIELYKLVSGRIQVVGGNGAVVSCQDAPLLEGTSSSVVLNNDATMLYVGDSQGIIGTWDVGTRQLIKSSKPLRGGAVENLALADYVPAELPQLQRIVGEQADFVLDAKTPQCLLDFELQGATVVQGQLAPAAAAAAAAPAAPADSSEIDQLKKRNKELQALYDKLWAETN